MLNVDRYERIMLGRFSKLCIVCWKSHQRRTHRHAWNQKFRRQLTSLWKFQEERKEF